MNKTARTLTALATLAVLSLSSSLAQGSRPVVVSSGCEVKGAFDRFTSLLGPTRFSSAANWSGYQNADWTPPRGYRHVTWDGVDKKFTDYNYIPNDYFNTALKQGLIYSTKGNGFRVSSDVYGYLNASYKQVYKPYSGYNLFSPLYSNVLDVNFETPGYKGDRARVHGFGTIFADVDKANVTRMEFFDEGGYSLGLWYAEPCDYGHSFLGVYFADKWVSKVRIWLGDKPMDAYQNEDAYTDLVALDDFVYDEPWKWGYSYKAADTYREPAYKEPAYKEPAYTAPVAPPSY